MKTNKEFKIETHVIYANHTQDDILLHDELNEIEKLNSDLFKMWYTLGAQAPKGWPYSKGHVSEEMVREHIFPNSKCTAQDTIVLLCGPVPLTDLCETLIKKVFTDVPAITF